MAKQKMKAIKKEDNLVDADKLLLDFAEGGRILQSGSASIMVGILASYILLMSIYSNPIPSLIIILVLAFIDFIISTIKWGKWKRQILNQ